LRQCFSPLSGAAASNHLIFEFAEGEKRFRVKPQARIQLLALAKNSTFGNPNRPEALKLSSPHLVTLQCRWREPSPSLNPDVGAAIRRRCLVADRAFATNRSRSAPGSRNAAAASALGCRMPQSPGSPYCAEHGPCSGPTAPHQGPHASIEPGRTWPNSSQRAGKGTKNAAPVERD
jgi:hypothetical protein